MPEAGRLPTLTARRVALRWMVEDDLDDVLAVFSDAEAMRFWSSPPMTDIAQARRLLEEIEEHYKDGGLFEWGIARLDDDKIIGTCTLAAIDPQNRRAEVGFALAPAYWGRGYATEALSRLFDHAFDDLKLHRIEADVDPRNAASIRALERQGFVREGLLRERWFVAGQVADTAFYGLLARERKRIDTTRAPDSGQ